MDKRIAEWLASNDTGSSSEAIMLWLSAGVKDEKWGASTPRDPSDLGRCLRLLERIPEWKARMPEMAGAGGDWPTFVEHWDEMAASMEAEVGIDWAKARSAPKTYALMKQVEAKAAANAGARRGSVDLGNGVSIRFGGAA